MLFILFLIQILFIVFFVFLIYFGKKKPSFFGLFILIFQFLTICYLILLRIASVEGISKFFFIYILLIPSTLPHIIKFFHVDRESKMKKLIAEFVERLDQNFFNLFLYNQISFFLSRKFFLYVFKKIQRYLLNPKKFLIVLLVPFLILIFFIVWEGLMRERMYFSGIFFALYFLTYRTLLLVCRINEKYSEESLNYLKITFRKMHFGEDVISHFQNKANFLNISDENIKNNNFVINWWSIYYSGMVYSASLKLSSEIHKRFLPYYYNLSLFIALTIACEAFLLNLARVYVVFYVLALVIFFYGCIILGYILKDSLKKPEIVSSLVPMQIELYRQKLLTEVFESFRRSFSFLNLKENLIIPKNNLPYNFIELFNRNMELGLPEKKSIKESLFYLFLFIIFFFCNYYFYDSQSFLLFSQDISWLFQPLKIVVVLFKSTYLAFLMLVLILFF